MVLMFCYFMSEGGKTLDLCILSNSGQFWETEVDNGFKTCTLNTCVNLPRFYKDCGVPSFISHSGGTLSHKGEDSCNYRTTFCNTNFIFGAVLPRFLKTISPLGGVFYC